LDGITSVLTFQAPVEPGVVNHMKLAIADASDGIYDSAVFIQAGSLVSNDNPVADLSLLPQSAAEPAKVTAIIEGEDPHGLPLTYTIDWGDGTTTSGPLDSPTDDDEKTAVVEHTYQSNGEFFVTLTVSNGSLSGTSIEDVDIGGSGGGSGGGGSVAIPPVVVTDPTDQFVSEGEVFTFTAWASGEPAPDIQWQVSTDSGATFADIPGANEAAYSAIASLADDGNWYQAMFTNDEGDAVSAAALLTVSVAAPSDTTRPDAPLVALAEDTGSSATDNITSVGLLTLAGLETDAAVEYSVDGGTSWSGDFAAAEGANSVQVRQVDEAGNVSDAALLDFLLDTDAPAAVDPALLADTGLSATDNITNQGALNLSGTEAEAVVEYSTDAGATWSSSFTPAEGLNSVSVRQADAAGNVGTAGTLNFVLDTKAPQLNPTFSTGTQRILVNAKGVTVSANASDETGIASQTAGAVNTATPGVKSVSCTATDMAGNSAAVNVSYVVGYALVNVKPVAGATFNKKASIPVSFQLQDANGLLSDAAAAKLASKITITFDNKKFNGVKYDKKTNEFSLNLKISKVTSGLHILGIHVLAGAAEVATATLPVNLV
jgi:hypothetical protein